MTRNTSRRSGKSMPRSPGWRRRLTRERAGPIDVQPRSSREGPGASAHFRSTEPGGLCGNAPRRGTASRRRPRRRSSRPRRLRGQLPSAKRSSRRRVVVRGRELSSLRAARPADWPRLGSFGRHRAAGGATARSAHRRRVAGTGSDGAPRSHVSRPEGLPLRRVAGPADVPGAVGGGQAGGR